MKYLLLVLVLGFGGMAHAQTVAPCHMDFDRSGEVDLLDFLLFSAAYGAKVEPCPRPVDADSLALVTTLQDSINALQAALDATRFAVTTSQDVIETLQAQLGETQRLLTHKADSLVERVDYWRQSYRTLEDVCNAQTDAEPQPEPQPPQTPGCPRGTITRDACNDNQIIVIDGYEYCDVGNSCVILIEPQPQPQQPAWDKERFCALSEMTIEDISPLLIAGLITQEQLADITSSDDGNDDVAILYGRIKAIAGCPTVDPQSCAAAVNALDPLFARGRVTQDDLKSIADNWPESGFYTGIYSVVGSSLVSISVTVWGGLSTQDEKIAQAKEWFGCQ